jgi:hypothetical protein
MTEYRKALFHARACVKCIRKALILARGDPDAPLDDEPASGEANYGDDPDPLPNPRSWSVH